MVLTCARCQIQFSFRAKHNRAKLTISNSHAASEVRTQHSLAHTQRPSPSTRLVECGVIRSIAACAVNPPALVQRDHTDWLPERRLLHSTLRQQRARFNSLCHRNRRSFNVSHRVVLHAWSVCQAPCPSCLCSTLTCTRDEWFNFARSDRYRPTAAAPATTRCALQPSCQSVIRHALTRLLCLQHTASLCREVDFAPPEQPLSTFSPPARVSNTVDHTRAAPRKHAACV